MHLCSPTFRTQRATLQALSKYKQRFSKHKFQLSARKYKKNNLIQKKLNTHELKGNILYKSNFANLTIQFFAQNLLCILQNISF